MEEKLLKSINKRLEVMIALLLHISLQNPEKSLLREQIRILNHLSVEPKDIASILGRTRTFINKELSRLRKSRKNKE